MQENSVRLDSLPIGKFGRVKNINSKGDERRRMLDLGLTSGTKIEAVQKSPSGDPIAYFIRGAVIALRKEDAGKIEIEMWS